FKPSVPLLRKALLGVAIGEGGTNGGATYSFSPKRQCLLGVAAHSLSLRGGTASLKLSSSSEESPAFSVIPMPRSVTGSVGNTRSTVWISRTRRFARRP